MDANYIINRIRSARHQYPTVQLLKNRVANLDNFSQVNLYNELKRAYYKHENADIQESLAEFVYKMPMAS